MGCCVVLVVVPELCVSSVLQCLSDDKASPSKAGKCILAGRFSESSIDVFTVDWTRFSSINYSNHDEFL